MIADNGGRATDPERVADALGQLERGSFRFTGENPANGSNVETCTSRPWRSCSRPDGTPLRHWVGGWRGAWSFGGDTCDGGTP